MAKTYNNRNFNNRRRIRININRFIRAERIRVIDSDGTQIGIVPLEEGLKTAQQRELDLVEISAGASPPVCRVMDFNKYKYQQ